MGSVTPNYNLYKPDAGENGWAKKFKDNIDIIDSMIQNTLATTTTVGAVKVGNGLEVESDGTIKAAAVASVVGTTLVFNDGSATVSGEKLIIM